MKLDDLISRATAIEYLITNMGWHDEDGYEVDDADEKRKVITDLVNGIPAVDAAPVVHGKWISVKDRMPPEAGWYWVYAPYYSGGSSSGLKCIDGVMFARWSGKAWSIEVGYHKRPGCVTHWMQIPDPPKEAEHERQ